MFASNYEFIHHATNDIVSAVYPMIKHLESEKNKRTLLGGSTEVGSRFDELGIPGGLYLATIHRGFEPIKNKQTSCTTIDDQLFDKLLGNISSVKPYSGTRKNREKLKVKVKLNKTK